MEHHTNGENVNDIDNVDLPVEPLCSPSTSGTKGHTYSKSNGNLSGSTECRIVNGYCKRSASTSGNFVSNSYYNNNSSTVTTASEEEDDDSSTENDSCDDENLSISDDGCIYTYKGDHVADLPSSFYSLEVPPLEGLAIQEGDQRNNDNSSPEMDFLEMDFDDPDSEAAPPPPPPPPPEEQEVAPRVVEEFQPQPSTSKQCELDVPKRMPSWSCVLASQRKAQTPTTSGRLLRHRLRHRRECHTVVDTNTPSRGGKVMLWTEQEATQKQITQIGPSSCGATAVLNVLTALRVPLPGVEAVETRMRAPDSAPLTEYLLGRSRAGSTHRDLIRGLYMASEGRVYARFFHMWPERIVNVTTWLAYWLERGVVPIATLNLQQRVGSAPLADSWHHQMVYGAGPEGVYVTNPLECLSEDQLKAQLCSDSVLLVRSRDVIARWNPRIDLPQLRKIQDVRWHHINVIGQVAKVIRENRRDQNRVTSHVRIPADYKAGFTLAVLIDTPAFSLLRHSSELPKLQDDL